MTEDVATANVEGVNKKAHPKPTSDANAWMRCVHAAIIDGQDASIVRLGWQQDIETTREFLRQLAEAEGYAFSDLGKVWALRLLVPFRLFEITRCSDRQLCYQWRNLSVCSFASRHRDVDYWQSRAELLKRTEAYGMDSPFAALLMRLEGLGDFRHNPYLEIPKPNTLTLKHA